MANTEFIYTTYIKTTPEKVWNALTNPEFAAQYWSGHGIISDLKKGSKWKLADIKDNSAVKCVGEVVESVPPKRLVLTWADPANETDVSRVTFEIEATDDAVRLNIVHNDFKPGSDMMQRISGGWPRVLSSLKTLLETGQALGNVSSCASKEAKGAAA
jgi:uncharacterized protein YndB with AHSA1/START domain